MIVYKFVDNYGVKDVDARRARGVRSLNIFGEPGSARFAPFPQPSDGFQPAASRVWPVLREYVLSSDVGTEGTSQVVELIKQEIVFGRLRPRERLIEEDLSQKFGASRHQIRAAFTELERIGLVIRRPNKGVVVRELSVAETEQFFEMAALLQAEVAKRIPLPIDPATLQRLEGIYEEYCTAIDRHDLATVSEVTNAFHLVMFEASNNLCLADLLQQIWTVMLPIRCYAIAIPELLARARQELGYVLEALRTNDRRELLRVYVDHIWPTLDAYKRAHGAWSSKPVRPSPALASKEAVNPRRKASA